MKKIILFALIVASINSFGQSERAKETQEIVDWHKTNNRIITLSQEKSQDIEDYEFVGFEKTTKSQWNFVHLRKGKFVMIDTINQKNLTEKELKKFNKRLKKEANKLKLRALAGDYATNDEKIPFHVIESNFKLLFDSDIVIMGNNEISGVSLSENQFGLMSLKLQDLIVKKIQGLKSKKVYYVVEINSEIYLVSEEDFKKPIIQKRELRDSVDRQIQIREMDQLKNESVNWMDTNFNEVFPDGKLYVYKVNYRKCNGPFDDTLVIESFSYSNISPNNIVKSDFASNDGYIFMSSEYFTEIDLFEAITQKTPYFIDSIYFSYGWDGDHGSGITGTSAYRFWNKSESQHYFFDDAKNAIIKSSSTKNIYNEKYFTNLLNKHLKEEILTEAFGLYIKTTSTTVQRAGRAVKVVSGIEIYEKQTGSKIKISVLEKDQKVSFSSVFVNNGNLPGNQVKELGETIKEFDLRIDKKNFQFVHVNPTFLGKERPYLNPPFYYTPLYQLSPELLKSEYIKRCVSEIEGFYIYRKDPENNYWK